jgi:hypothetical protein
VLVACCLVMVSGCALTNKTKSLVDPAQTSIPSWVDIPTIIAASEQVLLARGYTIIRDNATASEGEVLGSASYDPTSTFGITRRVLITARAADGGTVVRVSHMPWRNRHSAAVVMREVRAQLGLR